jgi:hypothetical protein
MSAAQLESIISIGCLMGSSDASARANRTERIVAGLALRCREQTEKYRANVTQPRHGVSAVSTSITACEGRVAVTGARGLLGPTKPHLWDGRPDLGGNIPGAAAGRRRQPWTAARAACS